MNPIFLPNRASIYGYTVVVRGLQEIRDRVLIYEVVPCKVVQERGKWINGIYVLETSNDTSIIFEKDIDIEMGYEVVVGDKRYVISDIQHRNFASGYEAGKRATCNRI